MNSWKLAKEVKQANDASDDLTEMNDETGPPVLLTMGMYKV